MEPVTSAATEMGSNLMPAAQAGTGASTAAGSVSGEEGGRARIEGGERDVSGGSTVAVPEVAGGYQQ